MNKTIEVIPGSGGDKIHVYIGKFAPYDVGLTIGEIIQGLPDPRTARMCVTDIMEALSEHESANENPINEFIQYLAVAISEELIEMGFKLNAATTAALNIVVTPKTPTQNIEITIEYDETKL